MLQEREFERLYTQPIQPIELDGESFALPGDFVKGLAFLKPFLIREKNGQREDEVNRKRCVAPTLTA